ncbi:MAG: hypothetical protein RLZZ70_641 [Candidatus Parcubacteria bacterium]|jgi:hypothetical protein
MNKTYIWVIGGIIVLCGLGYLLLQSTVMQFKNTPKVTEDPLGVTEAFVSNWLLARQSTTSNPYDAGLLVSDVLTEQTRSYLLSKQGDLGSGIDPVLCQTVLPPRFGVKSVYEASTTAQVLVIPRQQATRTAEVALVDLGLIDYAWRITGITCSSGETTPDREFTFMESGFLKKGLEAPFDASKWYIIFTQASGETNAVPLLFTASSTCTLRDSAATTCDPLQLQDTSRITVTGTLLEEGASVATLIVNE